MLTVKRFRMSYTNSSQEMITDKQSLSEEKKKLTSPINGDALLRKVPQKSDDLPKAQEKEKYERRNSCGRRKYRVYRSSNF